MDYTDQGLVEMPELISDATTTTTTITQAPIEELPHTGPELGLGLLGLALIVAGAAIRFRA